MFKFPVQFVKDNIIFTKNKCYAGFKFGGFEYNSKSTTKKISIMNNLKDFIKDIPEEAQILLVPRKKSCRDALVPMMDKVREDDPLKDVSELILGQTIEILEDREKEKRVFNEEIEEEEVFNGLKEYEYDNYIFISILEAAEGDFIERGEDFIENVFKEPVQAFNRLLGIADKYVSESRFKLIRKKANSFLESQKMNMNIRKLKKKEIENLITRITKRGLDLENDNLNVGFIKIEESEEIIIPRRDAYKNRVKGAIKQGSRCLKIDHGDFISYQSFISILDIPNLQFPGGEYIKSIQDNYPGAEICIQLKKNSTEESKSKLNGKARQIASQMGEANEGGHEVDDDLIEGKIAVDEFKSEINKNDGHIIEASISVCLSGIDEKVVRSEAKELVKSFNKKGFNLVNPLTDQYKLFMEFIPGSSMYTRDYVDIIAMNTLAGGIIGANDRIGDDIGNFIAYTDSGKKVHLYLGRAPHENKSPAMFIAGNLGYGKSFNANLILMLHVLSGSSAIIFDPKSERTHWKNYFEFMSDLISVVRLTSSDEDKGKLDPFNVYSDDVNSACDLALNIVCELTGITPTDDKYIVLKEVLVKMRNEEKRSMIRLIELLETSYEDEKMEEIKKAAAMLARGLRGMAKDGLPKLMFGDGTEEAIGINNRLNILQIDQLKMPEAATKKDEYTEEERVSTCLMMLMSSFAKKFAMKKRDTFDLILFDESWFLKNTSEGKKLFDFLARQGRSLNCGCIFNGHSVLDIPSEEIKNTLTYKLFFKTENVKEAERMLDFMKIEKSQENIDMILKLENRQAIFQDLDGRVEKITFDAIFDIFIDTFNTKPKDTINLDENKEAEGRI